MEETTGRYHSVSRVYKGPVVQCGDCDVTMPTQELSAIVDTCIRDIGTRLSDSERTLRNLLDNWYGTKQRWGLADLRRAIQDGLKNSYGNPPVISWVNENRWIYLGINYKLFDFIEKDDGGYLIGWVDAHARDGFNFQLNHIANCINILQYEWHITDEYGNYIRSFNTLNQAENWIKAQGGSYTIYHGNKQYKTFSY